MSRERFKVRVTKDHLVFSAGHFISYEGDQCERLHQYCHNYDGTVRILHIIDRFLRQRTGDSHDPSNTSGLRNPRPACDCD